MHTPTWFDRFAQRATGHVGRPWFFLIAVVAIVAWLPTLVLWDTGPSDLLVDSLTNPASLLLLILLQNSQNRGDAAKDARQDTLEHALADIIEQFAAQAEGDDQQRLRSRSEQLRKNAVATETLSSADVSQ